MRLLSYLFGHVARVFSSQSYLAMIKILVEFLITFVLIPCSKIVGFPPSLISVICIGYDWLNFPIGKFLNNFCVHLCYPTSLKAKGDTSFCPFISAVHLCALVCSIYSHFQPAEGPVWCCRRFKVLLPHFLGRQISAYTSPEATARTPASTLSWQTKTETGEYVCECEDMRRNTGVLWSTNPIDSSLMMKCA